MKIALFISYDVSKAAEIAQVSDKLSNTPGRKRLAQYGFQGIPFAGFPPNTVLAMSINEFESNEALLAVEWPYALAGATPWAVPIFEVPSGSAETTMKGYKK